MRTLRTLLTAGVLAFLLTTPARVDAKTMNNKVGYLFTGVTEAYRLGGIRFGRNAWEFGIYPGGIGLGHVFRLKDASLYTVFAPVLGLFPGNSPGINGSVGWELPLVGILDLRIEFSNTVFASGTASPFVIAGINLHY